MGDPMQFGLPGVDLASGEHPQVILCLYDLQRHGAGILLDLLTTHPKVLLGGIVLENPHYLSPDEYQASRR
jgi:hypothetical protein